MPKCGILNAEKWRFKCQKWRLTFMKRTQQCTAPRQGCQIICTRSNRDQSISFNFQVFYIMRWRKRHRPLISGVTVETGVNGVGVAAAATNSVRKASILLSRTAINNSSRYAPVQLTDELKTPASIPFHDYDSSSEDEQLFRKPYSDEIK